MGTEYHGQVIALLAQASDKEISPDQVTRETLLREDLLLDSLQAVELVLDLEEKFGVSVDEQQIRALKTVGDVLDLVDTLAARMGMKPAEVAAAAAEVSVPGAPAAPADAPRS